MRKFIILSAHIVLTVLLLAACGGKGRTVSSVSGGDTLELRYASYLEMARYEEFVKVTVRNPWDTLKILHTYLLVDKGKPRPGHLPEGTVVRVPLSEALVYSSVHCGLMEELGAMDALKGVCDLPYIRIPSVLEGCRQGRIVDAGSSMNPDMERIIDLRPDAVLLSPFENSGGYGRIEKLDVPIIECADYMETSPLGRAEWVRFYGLLFGRGAEADSLFACTERNYHALRQKASSAKSKPSVISELKSGSAWYVPGGKSTTGQIVSDAGAEYVFADYCQSGSVPLSFETVLDKGQYADFWLIKYNQKFDKTYSELKSDYAPYAGFDAFRARHIYGCNTGRVNFYEEIPFHPDYLLKDLIKIFHPELLDDYTLRYYSSLSE